MNSNNFKFVGKPYEGEEEKKRILNSYDELEKTKLEFLNKAYDAESTWVTLWKLYSKHIHKFEIMLNKDLAYFKDDELNTLINRCFNLSEGTKNAIVTFINSYLAWSSTVTGRIASVIKLQNNTSEETKQRLLKKKLIDLDKFYNMLEEAEKTHTNEEGNTIQLHLILPILFFRYGIIGTQASWAINLRYRDVNKNSREVNIVDQDTGELITVLPVDDKFISYIEDAYMERINNGKSVSENMFILTSARSDEGLLATSVYNKVKVFCEIMGIERLSPTDLKKSRQLDLMMEYRLNNKAMYMSNIDKIAKRLYGQNISYGVVNNMKKLYMLVTGEEVFTDNRITYNSNNVPKVANNDIRQLVKNSINFEYNDKYFKGV